MEQSERFFFCHRESRSSSSSFIAKYFVRTPIRARYSGKFLELAIRYLLTRFVEFFAIFARLHMVASTLMISSHDVCASLFYYCLLFSSPCFASVRIASTILNGGYSISWNRQWEIGCKHKYLCVDLDGGLTKQKHAVNPLPFPSVSLLRCNLFSLCFILFGNQQAALSGWLWLAGCWLGVSLD